ncbi:hypothetical protein MKW98_027171 [Papaver atlanticum]|uniref:Uncharacterized protein n=1 Tax=Papaver atlanticum TaxID=357466 RepID=A0AAD4XQ29_9MAGN|nr:hypothetical protein MKW98_027171 [Papaver atlanticum]
MGMFTTILRIAKVRLVLRSIDASKLKLTGPNWRLISWRGVLGLCAGKAEINKMNKRWNVNCKISNQTTDRGGISAMKANKVLTDLLVYPREEEIFAAILERVVVAVLALGYASEFPKLPEDYSCGD